MTTYTTLPDFTIDFINFHANPLQYGTCEVIDNKLRIYLDDPDSGITLDEFDTEYPFEHDVFISDFMEYLDDNS